MTDWQNPVINCGSTMKSGKGCGECEACKEEAAATKPDAYVKPECWGVFTLEEQGFKVLRLTGNHTVTKYEIDAISFNGHKLWLLKDTLVSRWETRVVAEIACNRAKQLEKKLRPFWQAAIEHATRLERMMLEQVYAAARGE